MRMQGGRPGVRVAEVLMISAFASSCAAFSHHGNWLPRSAMSPSGCIYQMLHPRRPGSARTGPKFRRPLRNVALMQTSAGGVEPTRARISSAVFDEWAAEAWKNRDGYTFNDDELEDVLGKTEGRAAIALALKLLDKSGVYGEITERGFRELAVYLDLGLEDSFYDLGSGVGKTVAMAWLEMGCAASRGIELDATRHELGVEALAEMMSRYFTDVAPLEEERMRDGSSVLLLQGDILAADLEKATVVWCANLCMSEDFDRQLALKLAQQPQLRAVASLKNWPDGILGFEQTGKRRFEMSWTDSMDDPEAGGLVYVYTRDVARP